MSKLDIKSITCPDCGSHYFVISYIPNAKTYYLLCLDCQNNKRKPLKYISTELIPVSEIRTKTIICAEDKEKEKVMK